MILKVLLYRVLMTSPMKKKICLIKITKLLLTFSISFVVPLLTKDNKNAYELFILINMKDKIKSDIKILCFK